MMMMGLGRRRFVNLVAENIKSGVSSVHRLNVSERLFYPSTAEAEAEAAAKVVTRLKALPPPVTSFQSTPSRSTGQIFALVSPRRSSSESRILWNNPSDRTILYDVESHSTYAMPSLSTRGYDSIAISVAGRPDAPEEDLYVLSNHGTFQVVRFGHPKLNLLPNLPEAWHLETLPSPPLHQGALICSHAVLHGGRTICVTVLFVHGGGTDSTCATYLFDTVKRKWRRAPVGCDLPFSSGVEYDPNLKLWLGPCTMHHHLCASDDLDLAVDGRKPPTVKHKWEVLETPEDWVPAKVSVINLGGGRFCVFKVIHEVVPETDGLGEWDVVRQQLAVLTGVEIISSSSPEGGEEAGLVKMVRHKSLSYIFTKDAVRWVL